MHCVEASVVKPQLVDVRRTRVILPPDSSYRCGAAAVALAWPISPKASTPIAITGLGHISHFQNYDYKG